MRPVRNHLFEAGIPVENSKGEAETGQEELNIRYAEALDCADHHTIAKHAVKEIAWAMAIRRPSCRSGTPTRSAVVIACAPVAVGGRSVLPRRKGELRHVRH
jgi:hypothetical protein